MDKKLKNRIHMVVLYASIVALMIVSVINLEKVSVLEANVNEYIIIRDTSSVNEIARLKELIMKKDNAIDSLQKSIIKKDSIKNIKVITKVKGNRTINYKQKYIDFDRILKFYDNGYSIKYNDNIIVNQTGVRQIRLSFVLK